MPKKEYDWNIGSPPPKIGIHSLSKHRVFTKYLEHYLKIINSNPVIESCRLSIVDGFAGGGIYTHPLDGSEYPGSPLQLIKITQDAIRDINIERDIQKIRNKLALDSNFYFFEKKECNYLYLLQLMRDRGYGRRLNKDIFVEKGELSEYINPLLLKLTQKSKQHRAIFFLDQYGYKDVPPFLLKRIFDALPNAEIILTFAVDSLINYMSDKPEFVKALKSAGLSEVFSLDEMIQSKQENNEWKFIVQTHLLDIFQKQCGAAFYTPFFIKSNESNRSFWLIHLSNHPRARDAMTQLHWELSNQFIHLGDSGLQMFGYDPTSDASLTRIQDMFSGTEYSFDEMARSRTMNSLVDEIPKCLRNLVTPIQFNEFFKIVTNHTPATAFIIKQALEDMVSKKEIIVMSESSSYRKKATTINGKDMISFPTQKTFSFSNNKYLGQ